MIPHHIILLFLALMSSFNLFGQGRRMESQLNKHPDAKGFTFSLKKAEEQWKKDLSPEQYQILRQKGTERPYTGQYTSHKENGVYTCAACGHELFTSNEKFDSHCGWPSFYDAIDNKNIVTQTDVSHGMVRTEIMCANCGGHLGHLFDDGPQDKTGLRYCVNSVSLNFKAVHVDKAKK